MRPLCHRPPPLLQATTRYAATRHATAAPPTPPNPHAFPLSDVFKPPSNQALGGRPPYLHSFHDHHQALPATLHVCTTQSSVPHNHASAPGPHPRTSGPPASDRPWKAHPHPSISATHPAPSSLLVSPCSCRPRARPWPLQVLIRKNYTHLSSTPYAPFSFRAPTPCPMHLPHPRTTNPLLVWVRVVYIPIPPAQPAPSSLSRIPTPGHVLLPRACTQHAPQRLVCHRC